MSGSLRILICDDSKLIRSLLTKMLACDPEIQVVGEAADGHECLQAIRDLHPDLVLLDMVMPVLDGLGTLREARELGLHTEFVVVSESAGNSEQRTQAALDAGAAAVVVRPHALLAMEQIQAHLIERIHQVRDRHERLAAVAH